MTKISVKAKGLTRTEQLLKDKRKKYPGAFAAALFQVGGDIFSESQEEVPVDTGRLRASGGVYPPPFIKNPVVKIGYGTNYGLYVHEDPKKRHGPVIGRGVGQKYKFLEDPFNRALKTFREKLARYFRKNIIKKTWTPPTTPEEGKKGSNKKMKREARVDANKKRRAGLKKKRDAEKARRDAAKRARSGIKKRGINLLG